MTCDLWYRAEIPGRGEFVRLALEAGGIVYRDRAREEGSEALVRDMAARSGQAPFAPPYLVAGDLCIAQTANILLLLGERHLGPDSAADRHFAHTLQLTIADAVAEAHNVHHPVAVDLYYDEQKPEIRAQTPGSDDVRYGWKADSSQHLVDEPGDRLQGRTVASAVQSPRSAALKNAIAAASVTAWV